MSEHLLLNVLDNRRLTESVVALKLDAGELVKTAVPGQFLHIRCLDGSVLRRPVSICDLSGGALTLTVEIRGAGTAWLSRRRPGDRLDVLGPLGRGFDMTASNIVLAGGGLGAAPLLFAARASGAQTAVLGFRNKDSVVLADEFRSFCKQVYITTDDGSYGEYGTVAQPLERLLRTKTVGAVLACGPRPMLKAVAGLTAACGVPCQVSLEERMACGIGACLVCACRTQTDGKEEMKRVCRDGPVFNAEEVVW